MIPIIILAIEDDNDREFMASIYIELYPLMRKTAHDIVNDWSAVEDIVHDTIASLINNLETIREYEKPHLVSYIAKSVRNHSINYSNKHMKDHGRTLYGLEDDWAESIPDNLETPEERFERILEYEELGEAMKRLPEAEREILHLKYNMGMDNQEIGEIMGMSKDSVRMYLTRARRSAKNCIIDRGVMVEQ